jgi:type I restriction enzyme S subunit
MSETTPFTWAIKKIGEIATVSSGGTPDRTNPEFYDGKNPWVKSGEINLRKIRNTEEHISDSAIEQSSAKWVPKGAVLVAMYGATAGKVARLMIDATLNQAISAVVTKDDSSHSDYLFHSLEFNSEELLKSLQGSGQPNLSGGLIKGLKILLPPPPEQQKIAAILTAVDEVIESTQAQINKLKDLKTGMMQELLTKGTAE